MTKDFKVEDLTFSTMRHSTPMKAAMHYLGYTDWHPMKMTTWTLETEVISAALQAYDDVQANGFLTAGNVPKPKTRTMWMEDQAVWRRLVRLASFALGGPNQSDYATEQTLREAWQAGLDAHS